MTDLFTKTALTAIAIALCTLALRPAAEIADAADIKNLGLTSDPAFERAVVYVVNRHCDVVKRPKGDPKDNLELTCRFPG